MQTKIFGLNAILVLSLGGCLGTKGETPKNTETPKPPTPTEVPPPAPGVDAPTTVRKAGMTVNPAELYGKWTMEVIDLGSEKYTMSVLIEADRATFEIECEMAQGKATASVTVPATVSESGIEFPREDAGVQDFCSVKADKGSWIYTAFDGKALSVKTDQGADFRYFRVK